MKQKVAVRAIIRHEGKTLLLRRATGRQTILEQYELPGGSLGRSEQPEDALRRTLHEGAGLHIQTAQLFDAVTYIDHDTRDVQYVVLVYLVSLVGGVQQPVFADRYDASEWITMSNMQHLKTTDLTNLLLGIIQHDTKTDDERTVIVHDDVKTSSNESVIIYTDGGSRGNPGPSAAGFVIVNTRQELIEQGGEYLGITTSSQAEYQAVRLGLERALELGYKNVEFRIDSMLVVNQMNGIYKIKNRDLWPIHDRIRSLLGEFLTVRFSHVKREFNTLADGMVNKTLDQHQQHKR